MNEILSLIFDLEDSIGKTIVGAIIWVFWIGIINYTIHFLWILYDFVCLRFVRHKINKGQDVLSTELLNSISESIIIQLVIRGSLIYRRIRALLQIHHRGGEIDQEILGDIHAGVSSRKASLSNYLLGILIILGLVGTLWGLTVAVVEVQPLVEDIDDLDQLPQISQALRETLKGMGTAFKTTLAGLVTSLGLGLCGWGFNLTNSMFLTNFETVVSTHIIPHFTQSSETTIASSMDGLKVTVDEFKMATEDNVRKMQESIQELTGKSWDSYLEQQYVITTELREIPSELRESLGGINEYQVLIKSIVEESKENTSRFMSQISGFQTTIEKMVNDYRGLTEQTITQVSDFESNVRSIVNDFEKFIETLIAQVSDNQSAIHAGLENVVSEFRQESAGLRATIRESQDSQERFVNELATNLSTTLANTLENQLQSMLEPITESQNAMLQEFQQVRNDLRVAMHGLDISSALENQNQVFEEFTTRIERTMSELMDSQNTIFNGIRSQLKENQNEMRTMLSNMISELEIRSALESQNKVFGRIEAHLGGQGTLVSEQKEIIQTLNSSVQQLKHSLDQQGSENTLEQILLRFHTLDENFHTLGTKLDTLNTTMNKPNLYRWGPVIRNWIPFIRNKN